MEKLNLLGVRVDRVTMGDAMAQIMNRLEHGRKTFVITPNSEIIVMATKERRLRSIIEKADLVVPDGIGLVIASKIQHKALQERVTGIDLMERLIAYASLNAKTVYFLGAKKGIAQLAAQNLKKRYHHLEVAGCHHGYYKGIQSGFPGHEEELQVVAEIAEKKPDFLFVGFGAPSQEYFIDTYQDQLGAGVMIGIGGSMDVFSGTVKRAPEFYQKIGMEWLYRAIKEPTRLKRLGALPIFLGKVLLTPVSSTTGRK